MVKPIVSYLTFGNSFSTALGEKENKLGTFVQHAIVITATMCQECVCYVVEYKHVLISETFQEL